MRVGRAFLTYCVAIVGGFGILSSAAAEDKGQVVVATGGGSYLDALRTAVIKPFEKATGIKVVEASGPSLAKLRAMINTGNPEWDVVEMVPEDFEQLSSEGMLQKLDYTKMDQAVLAGFPKDAVRPFGIGSVEYASVISFNTKKYTQANGPKSWADVWDVKKFPGPRALNAGNGLVPSVEHALLADGVPSDKLYPIDFKRAYASLSRIRPDVVKWATTAAMQPEALASGEAVIAAASQPRIQLLKEQGAPVDYVWNQALTEHTYWTILKGSKNVSNAQKFIEFASRAESQAALSKLFILGPMNQKAYELIPRERAKLLPTYPENKAKTIEHNGAWWARKEASGKSNLEVNNGLWNNWIQQR